LVFGRFADGMVHGGMMAGFGRFVNNDSR
jgi:hypothetical protein